MIRLVLLLVPALMTDAVSPDDVFAERRHRRMEACMHIPAAAYSTALLFNPPGYKTYFHRAECLQRLAIDEHDPELCSHVHERKSWFFDGSAISSEACRAGVARVLADDQRALDEFLDSTPYRVASIVVRRNGNGKDYDVLLDTAGSYPGRYDFTLYTVKASKRVPILETSHYLGPTTATLHLLLRAQHLERELGAGWLEKEWLMRGRLSLTRNAKNRFWYERIPAHLATDLREFTVAFDRLAPWVPEASRSR